MLVDKRMRTEVKCDRVIVERIEIRKVVLLK